MSTAYFIVLDSDDPGFDPFVDGKLLTRELESVNRVAEGLGLKRFEDYASQDLSEFGGPEMEPVWFDGSEGVEWASAILLRLRENPISGNEMSGVIEDLEDYVRVFSEAHKRGLRWHLELDF